MRGLSRSPLNQDLNLKKYCSTRLSRFTIAQPPEHLTRNLYYSTPASVGYGGKGVGLGATIGSALSQGVARPATRGIW